MCIVFPSRDGFGLGPGRGASHPTDWPVSAGRPSFCDVRPMFPTAWPSLPFGPPTHRRRTRKGWGEKGKKNSARSQPQAGVVAHMPARRSETNGTPHVPNQGTGQGLAVWHHKCVRRKANSFVVLVDLWFSHSFFGQQNNFQLILAGSCTGTHIYCVFVLF